MEFHQASWRSLWGAFCFASPSGWFWLRPVSSLLRFGLPLDLAFLIVAVVAIVISLILLRSGVGALKPSRLVPAKSISQISSLFGGL